MTVSDSSLQLVILLTVTLVVVVPASIFGLVVLGARYLTWISQYLTESGERLNEIYAKNPQRIAFWQRADWIVVVVLWLLSALIIITAKWYAIIALMMISFPIILIYSGLHIMDLQYT